MMPVVTAAAIPDVASGTDGPAADDGVDCLDLERLK
jgi:hypothetical protein